MTRANGRRARQRGSVMPIVAFVSLFIAVLGFGGAVLGRHVAERQDTQRAADGAALALADLVRERGFPVNTRLALEVGQRNNQQQTGFDPAVTQQLDRVVVSMGASSGVEAPRWIYGQSNLPVNTHARAMIGQRVFTNANWQYPKVCLVLDFSGSMSGEPIGRLKNGVRRILDYNFPIDYAGVLFNSEVIGDVEFSEAAVLETLREMIRSNEAGGGTATNLALERAYQIIQNGRDGKRDYTLLVSDGAPNDEAAARTAGQRLWDLGETFTLHIGAGGAAENFMVDISGGRDTSAEDRRHEYYHQVTNLQTLEAALEKIISRMACPIGPIDMTQVEDVSTITVFLRDPGGRERRIPEVENFLGSLGQEGYSFEPRTGRFIMTFPACAAIVERNNDVVIRYNRAKLIE